MWHLWVSHQTNRWNNLSQEQDATYLMVLCDLPVFKLQEWRFWQRNREADWSELRMCLANWSQGEGTHG